MSSSPVMVSLAPPVEADPDPGPQSRRPRQPSRRSSHDAAPARGCVHPRSADAYAVQQEGSGEAARDGADDAGREAPPSEFGRSLGLAARAKRDCAAISPLTRPDRSTAPVVPLRWGARSPGRFGACSVARAKPWPAGARARSFPDTRCVRRTWRVIADGRPLSRGLGRSYGDSSLPARRDHEVVSHGPRRSHPVVRRRTAASCAPRPACRWTTSIVCSCRADGSSRSRPAPSS